MMLRRNDRNLENIPVGALGLIALDGCTEMGAPYCTLFCFSLGAICTNS